MSATMGCIQVGLHIVVESGMYPLIKNRETENQQLLHLIIHPLSNVKVNMTLKDAIYFLNAHYHSYYAWFIQKVHLHVIPKRTTVFFRWHYQFLSVNHYILAMPIFNIYTTNPRWIKFKPNPGFFYIEWDGANFFSVAATLTYLNFLRKDKFVYLQLYWGKELQSHDAV